MHTHLNRGNYFANKYNYYNAIREYSDAIKNDKEIVWGHANAAIIYFDLGLIKIALNQINYSISLVENGLKDIFNKDYALYSIRGSILGKLSFYSEMQSDINKCLSLKGTIHLNAFKTIMLYYVKTNQNNLIHDLIEDTSKKANEIEEFKYFIHDDLEYFKRDFHAFLCNTYVVIGDLDNAISEINKAIKLNDKILRYHYKLGEVLYKKNNIELAENIYKSVSKKNKLFIPYDVNQYKEGIIISVSSNGKSGMILTDTFFNKWDAIFYNNDNENFDLHEGDLVRFKLDYFIENNLKKGYTKNLRKINFIDYKKLNKNLIFHCIVNFGKNINNDFSSFIFVYVFYPTRFLLPFYMLKNKLTEQQYVELNSKGFIFLEIYFTGDNNNYKIAELKPIEKNNQFTTITYPKITNKKETFKTLKTHNKKECNVCHFDEWCGTDGCPLDPT